MGSLPRCLGRRGQNVHGDILPGAVLHERCLSSGCRQSIPDCAGHRHEGTGKSSRGGGRPAGRGVSEGSGWIQLYMESCQEILDSIIMAYPVGRGLGGFASCKRLLRGVLSFPQFPTRGHPQAGRRGSLPGSPEGHGPAEIHPRRPHGLFQHEPGELYTEYRYKACAANQRAKEKFDWIDRNSKKHLAAATEARLKSQDGGC